MHPKPKLGMFCALSQTLTLLHLFCDTISVSIFAYFRKFVTRTPVAIAIKCVGNHMDRTEHCISYIKLFATAQQVYQVLLPLFK